MADREYYQTDMSNWRDRISRAQQTTFPDLVTITTPAVKCLLSHDAPKIGCREESLFVPLLTCCSHMMGVNTSIKVHDYWSEPTILWTLTCARRGSGKTAILKHLLMPILEIQCEHERQWHLSRPSSNQITASGSSPPPKLLAGPSSLTELYNILERNGGQILTLEENIKHLHRRLLTDDDKTILNSEELNNLYDAMPKFSSKHGEVSIMTTTCYNHTGMTSPEYLMELFYNPRLMVFDKYLIVCPGELCVPFDPATVTPAVKPASIKSIFQTLYMFHRQYREYVFTPEAGTELKNFTEKELWNLKSHFSQDNPIQYVLDKCLGQIVRLAGVLKALGTACALASQSTGTPFLKWDLSIDKESILKAIHLQRYFLEQKLILLLDKSLAKKLLSPCGLTTNILSMSPLPLAESSVTSVQETKSPPLSEYSDTYIPDFASMSIPQFVANYSNKIRRLLEYTDDGNGIPASVAAQYSIPPIVHIPGSSNRKPTWVAELFFKKVAELGIGRLCYIKHHGNRKYFLRFRRKRPEELTDRDRRLLDTVRVNMDLYNRIGNEYLPGEALLSPVEESVSPFVDEPNFTEHHESNSARHNEPMQDSAPVVAVKREIHSDIEEPHSSNC